MSQAVRLGIVGAGSVAIRGILPHLIQDDMKGIVELAAICDPVAGRAQAAAEKFGFKRSFESYEDLLEKGEVDAVCICSPIGVHYEQGKLAIEAGKHIHFNKSMTTTVQEANDLIELAAKKNIKMVASPGEMLRPHNQYIRKVIKEGKIGKLCWAACGAAFGTYHDHESVRQGKDVLSNIDPRWYFKKPGGGPLYDMTVYALHGLTGILGPAKKVTAMSGIRLKEREWKGQAVKCDADDNSIMLLDFGDAVFAMAYGTAHGAITEHFTGSYFGTEGSIVGGMLNGKPLEYPGHKEARQAENWIAGNQWLLPHIKGSHRNIEEQHVFEDLMQLVDWVKDDKPSIVTAERARHVIDIIESAYKSAETGMAQELTTTFNPEIHELALSLAK